MIFLSERQAAGVQRYSGCLLFGDEKTFLSKLREKLLVILSRLCYSMGETNKGRT